MVPSPTQTYDKISDICIMSLLRLKFKMDFLHCALLALVVLLAVYVARGSGFLREGVGLQEGGGFEQLLDRVVDAIS